MSTCRRAVHVWRDFRYFLTTVWVSLLFLSLLFCCCCYSETSGSRPFSHLLLPPSPLVLKEEEDRSPEALPIEHRTIKLHNKLAKVTNIFMIIKSYFLNQNVLFKLLSTIYVLLNFLTVQVNQVYDANSSASSTGTPRLRSPAMIWRHWVRGLPYWVKLGNGFRGMVRR